MIAELLTILSKFVIDVISALGYAGIVVTMAIESACIPLPSEIIMPFSGYLVFTGRFTMLGISLAGAIGCVVGSIVAYVVGVYGGRPFLEKYGKYFLISEKDIDKADKLFAKRGEAIVFFSRLLPVIRTFISLPAGIAKMNFTRFVVYSFIGSLPWCWFLGWIGLKLGENWNTLSPYFHKFDIVIGIIVLIGVIIFVHHHLPFKKRDNSV